MLISKKAGSFLSLILAVEVPGTKVRLFVSSYIANMGHLGDMSHGSAGNSRSSRRLVEAQTADIH